MTTEPTQLQFYDAAKAALAKAVKVDEVKNIHDKAAAVKAAARIAKDKKMEADAHELRMRAKRRLGQLIKEQERTVGLSAGARGSKKKGARVDDKPTLAEAGIDKNLAHQSRTAAKPTDAEFEQKVEAEKEQITAPKPVTVSEKPKPKKAAAKPRSRSISPEDIALKDFTARALELVRLTRNQKAKRFAKTALSDANIGHLVRFFSELAEIRFPRTTCAEIVRAVTALDKAAAS